MTSEVTKCSTPLHLAAEYSHPALVRFLMEQGAALDALNSEGKTCLETAMESNVSLSKHHKSRTVEVLMGNGSEEEGVGTSSADGIDVEEREDGGGGGRPGTAKCAGGVLSRCEALCRRDQRRRRAGREDWLEGQCLPSGRVSGGRPGTEKCAGGVLSRMAAARGSSKDAVQERAATVAESCRCDWREASVCRVAE